MATKGKTAIICFSSYFGGMEMDAFRIAKLLSASVNVTLIVKHGSLMDRYYREEAKNINLHFESINFLFPFSPTIISKVRNIIRKNDIKNIIFFGASELSSLYFSFLGLNINLIVRHGTTKSTSKKDFYHRLIYSNVNYHVAICEHIAQNVQQIIPLGKHSKIKVIYSSLRHFPETFNNTDYKTNRIVTLLHVGRITDGKGQIDAIKACEYLFIKNIPFKLTLVGEMDPDYVKDFNKVLVDLPYRTSIELPGYTSDVTRYYKTANIFIFPSKGEGLSNSFIEALSYGLICIAYNNTSFPEINQLGFDFFLAKDGDIDNLKNCLSEAIKYLNNHDFPILHNSILAKQLFSAQRVLDEFMDILL